MRRISLLLLVLAGCAGSDASPVRVAQRFHARLHERDDDGAHALLTEADRAAVPLETFPDALPPGLDLELFAQGQAVLDSVTLLSAAHDTATVALHTAGGDTDTLRLLATHRPLKLWRFELDRVHWRVSMRLAERALLDSLATTVRANADAADIGGVERAEAYLRVAEQNPTLAHPAALYAARSTVKRASVAEGLQVGLRVARWFTGDIVIEGSVENPASARIRTLRLVVQDEAGAEEQVDLWDVAPESTTPVRQMSRLKIGPLTHRVERIQVY